VSVTGSEFFHLGVVHNFSPPIRLIRNSVFFCTLLRCCFALLPSCRFLVFYGLLPVYPYTNCTLSYLDHLKLVRDAWEWSPLLSRSFLFPPDITPPSISRILAEIRTVLLYAMLRTCTPLRKQIAISIFSARFSRAERSSTSGDVLWSLSSSRPTAGRHCTPRSGVVPNYQFTPRWYMCVNLPLFRSHKCTPLPERILH